MPLEIFADKLQVDDRVPLLSWELGSHELQLLPPKHAFHIQVCIIIILDMIVCAILGAVMYHFILSTPRTKSVNNRQAFLTGFGFVIPMALMAPISIIYFLDIRSTTLRMGLACIPICTSLHCLEAMFGTTPSHASSSLQNFLIYCSSLMEVKAAKGRPTWATQESIISALMQYQLRFVLFTILMSVLVPVDFAPQTSSVDPTGLQISIQRSHLFNNFIGALLTSLSLSFSTFGVSILVQLILQVQIEQVVYNPMFSSKSPADFWGRRWNRLVHGLLKRGVYKPVRSQSYSKFIATLSTFLASGLLHEYVSALLFFCNVHEVNDSQCGVPPFGKHLLFFGWNGCLLLLEYLFSDLFVWVPKILPAPIVSALVILLALPVGHFFTGDLIAGGYFSSLQLAFPRIMIQKA